MIDRRLRVAVSGTHGNWSAARCAAHGADAIGVRCGFPDDRYALEIHEATSVLEGVPPLVGRFVETALDRSGELDSLVSVLPVDTIWVSEQVQLGAVLSLRARHPALRVVKSISACETEELLLSEAFRWRGLVDALALECRSVRDAEHVRLIGRSAISTPLIFRGKILEQDPRVLFAVRRPWGVAIEYDRLDLLASLVEVEVDEDPEDPRVDGFSLLEELLGGIAVKPDG